MNLMTIGIWMNTDSRNGVFPSVEEVLDGSTINLRHCCGPRWDFGLIVHVGIVVCGHDQPAFGITVEDPNCECVAIDP